VESVGSERYSVYCLAALTLWTGVLVEVDELGAGFGGGLAAELVVAVGCVVVEVQPEEA
jgi:hypothetical protein